MVKKMKLPSLFSKAPESAPTSSWPWPSCGNPKTLSFRASTAVGGHIFKTINSVYLDSTTTTVSTTDNPELGGGGDGESSVEAVIRGLRSADRLFFDPGETSSIMEAATSSRKIEDGKKDEDEVGDGDGDGDGFVVPILEDDDNERRRSRSVVVEVESRDPHVDFKRSMEEMVEAHGLKDWEGFEELLSCYLRVNGKRNHGYIIGAFVDLLLGLGFATSSSSPLSSSSSSSSSAISAQSPTSALSFSSSGVTSTSTSPCLSSLEEAEDEIEKTLDNASS